MSAVEYHRGNYTITTEPSKISCEKVHWFLTQYSYWAKNRSLETVSQSMANSLNFGILYQNDLVGFARIVTDYATFAWLCDVIISPDQRRQGLGIWMVECIINHPDLIGIKRMILATLDAHGLYEKYGKFKPLTNPERWMEKINPDAA